MRGCHIHYGPFGSRCTSEKFEEAAQEAALRKLESSLNFCQRRVALWRSSQGARGVVSPQNPCQNLYHVGGRDHHPRELRASEPRVETNQLEF